MDFDWESAEINCLDDFRVKLACQLCMYFEIFFVFPHSNIWQNLVYKKDYKSVDNPSKFRSKCPKVGKTKWNWFVYRFDMFCKTDNWCSNANIRVESL